jgi:hypothetical protein
MARPGPRSKGPRTQFTLRVPDDHFAKYKALAQAAGFTKINDYLAFKLAEVHGLPFGDSADVQQRLEFEPGRGAGTRRGTSAA